MFEGNYSCIIISIIIKKKINNEFIIVFRSCLRIAFIKNIYIYTRKCQIINNGRTIKYTIFLKKTNIYICVPTLGAGVLMS